MTAITQIQQTAKEVGRQYLHACALLNEMPTHVFVEEVLRGLAGGDTRDYIIHNELYLAIALATPDDVSGDEETMGRWTAEVEDEFVTLARGSEEGAFREVPEDSASGSSGSQ